MSSVVAGPWPDPRFANLTLLTLAANLGCTALQVRRWMSEGLPYVGDPTEPRFRLSDVRAWLDSQSAA